MAYTTEKEKAFRPCAKGEYCGNHDLNSSRQVNFSVVRVGRPRSCDAGASDEMDCRGFVGLYLRHDIPDACLPVGAIRTVAMPDELSEPPANEDA